MKQLVLDPDTGALGFAEVPEPRAGRGRVLVRVARSVVSTGTELAKLHLARKPLWEKARSRPDQVAQVLQSLQSEGVIATAQKVRERLATPQPLGYSLSGIVVECGEDCRDLGAGIAVACGGTTASHAECVQVPASLAVRVPRGVRLDDAAFATVGAIAMHGLRTGGVSLGDRVLILGLGLLGQIATRLCAAAGAHVFGVDPLADRARLALESGAELAECLLDRATTQAVLAWSGGRGADVILITAGGADSSAVAFAGEVARDRAKVVVVGQVDLEVPRDLYYHKELSLVVSRSYGPGRYDPEFEEKGYAYPPGFVPWDERRNMSEFLELIAGGRMRMEGLKGLELPFDRAPEGYAILSGKEGPAPISLVLGYPETGLGLVSAPVSTEGTPEPSARLSPVTFPPRRLRISILGVGNFATATLLPAIRAVKGVTLVRAVAGSPLRAEAVRRRWKFQSASASATESLVGSDSEVVFIATRHDNHASLAETALRAGRPVFVEKPLALDRAGLERVETVLSATAGRLMVGFNRRFAPATRWAIQALGANRASLRVLIRVNAGPLPDTHWLLDPDVGGGRLLGEVCHFLDLACFLAASLPVEVRAHGIDTRAHSSGYQSFHVESSFENGATAGIDYLSGGDSSLGKERIEIHRTGVSIVIDDFRSATLHRAGQRQTRSWAGRDKGHRAEVRAFLEAVRTGGPTPIPEAESLTSTAMTLAAARSIRERRPIPREEW
jgi:predicted dehydrogenase/threonine dehydrogenase-like Zn-dependent dehydrogenase